MRVSNLLAKSKKNLNGVFNKKSSMKGFMGMTDLKFRFYSSKEVPLSKLSESFLSGSNIGYVEEMYRSWRSDKSSVHKAWDVYFTNVDQGAPSGEAVTVPPSIGSTGAKHAGASFSNQVDSSELSDILKLHLLIRAYQVRGHLLADLDPLKLTKREVPPELKLETYGWSEKDLDKVFHIDRIENKILTPLLSNTGKVTLREIVDKLKNVYCGTLAFEYMHIPSREECSWLRQIIETNQISFSNDERITILDRLMWADKFESFLKAKFPTVKRFGLEGVESMIPCMKAIIDKSSEMGVEDVIIGMPHRGRMNVLSTVLRKPLESIFSLFKSGKSNTKEEEDVFGSGDVKYHLGTSHSRMTNSGKEVYLSLLSNPSHLEAVNPLVLGKVRARQLYKNDNERKKVLGLLLHGDAAFAGQGVVYECFDYSELRGFTTGGTIHLVVNNQIGFTTDPKDSRSSEYCTAVAKTVGAPIFHVNADDPEACVKAAYLAVMWRQKTGRDVVIDLIGYRRHGHNENDNPDFTQPVMYQAIKVQPTTLNIYAQHLLKQGVVNQQKTEQMESSIRQFMENAYVNSDSYVSKSSEWLSSRWKGFKGPQQQARIKNTGVSVETLQKVGVAMSTVPENFTLHPILRKLFDKRRQTFQDLKPGTMLDWASAELLAYGTLLLEGNTVRISGQDVERGTFSHRHAVVTDQKDGSKYIPLRRLDGSKGQFLIYNSNLSEYAVLGFEAGFSLENPNSLVIWEAQFGDFANGAQIIIDQFISSGEQKWLRQSGLTMLLPHGYDGMGPEHSSARLERFLQMSDSDPEIIPDPSLPLSVQMQNTNMQIVNCTTPANIFHLLRRQIHREFRKPLIVMSPKNMLRLDLCVSPLEDFDDTGDHTRFQHVIPEVEQNLLDAPEKIKKVVFCSGQVYYTLLKHRRTAQLKHVALVRVEQLAPFPFHLVMAQLQKYPNAKVVWAQEEPKNMGSWSFIAPHLNTCLEHINHSSRRVFYTGRAAAASPATGRGSTHISEEKAIIDQVFN